jgi:hypothetical protein
MDTAVETTFTLQKNISHGASFSRLKLAIDNAAISDSKKLRV